MIKFFDNFKPSESFISDLISALQDVAHLKDAKTKRYIHCNPFLLKSFGLEQPKDLIGSSVKDIDNFMRPHWGTKYANQIEKLDYLAEIEKTPISNNEITILRNGSIRYQHLVKIPILNNTSSKTSSIFTFTQDLTNTINLNDLYILYKNYYSGDIATRKYLIHIGAEKHFKKLPTEAEMKVLLARITNGGRHKEIGLLLNLSSKTIEMHLHNLKDKTINSDLFSVISSIQNFNLGIVRPNLQDVLHPKQFGFQLFN